MRLFIAVRFDRNIKDLLLRTQQEMRRLGVVGNYTSPENLHLTLAFIGEYSQPKTVIRALNQVRFSLLPLAVEPEIGHFGDLYWVGLAKNPSLSRLAWDVRDALGASGIPFDRKPFRGHITLIRKARFPDNNEDILRTLTLPEQSMTVREFSLMNSQRENGRLVYTELARFPASP